MNDKNIAVFGIYKTRAQVEHAVDALKSEGFGTADISVLMPDTTGFREFAHTKESKAPEGAVTGAGAGAVIGGTLGLLAGIGMLAIPGVGPLIAAGPIMASLAGLGVGGAIGGIGGGLIGLGVPEFEAKRYEGFVKEGGILLSVHTSTPEQKNRAEKCLEYTGAIDIASTGETKGSWNSYAARTVTDPKTSVTRTF